jgi:hypothetical protein
MEPLGKIRFERRELLRLGVGLAALGAAAGCGPERPYSAADAESLAEQERRERERSGGGPDGRLRFRGYRGLAELPWFEPAPGGGLRLAVELPPVFDVHVHLGMALLFAPALDLGRRTQRVHYLLDCDAAEPPCEIDLDVYVNSNFDAAARSRLRRELLAQGLWGSRAAATHTVPNLLAEMDALGIARAALLPIAFGLPFRDRLTESWLIAVERSGAGARLWPGASVHPRDPEKLVKLRGYAARGARIVKLHPAGQRCYADEPGALEIYAECERLGLPVLLHAGRAGLEPESVLGYNLPRHLEGALAAFPRLPFVLGHAGARDAGAVLALARAHPNAWLDVHGQAAGVLREILDALGPERLLFGSDWPWYPQALSLAKVLLVTEGRPEARRAVLGGNAERLFAAAERSASSGS